jgi:hypothetical protein
MRNLLRKLFWSDFKLERIICVVPDEITLINGRQKLKFRKIKGFLIRHNIENNFYKNFEED